MGGQSNPTVFVTGFGIWQGLPITAGFVAKLLPSTLTASDPLNTSNQDITLLTDLATLDPYLGTIRDTLREKHRELGAKVDLWIHLGQWASDALFVSCERRAYRQDFVSTWNKHGPTKHYYSSPAGDFKNVDDIGPNPWVPSNVPIGLDSEVPIDETVTGANAAIAASVTGGMGEDQRPYEVKPHHEPGGHACGFTFYESLANCYVNKRRRDVIFVHVPGLYEQVSYERTRDSVLAIIGSAVAAITKRDAQRPYEDD